MPADAKKEERRHPMFTPTFRRRALAISPVVALAALFVFAGGTSASAKAKDRNAPKPTIVLVHGDWADASSWTSVTERLQEKGFTVIAPPNPLRGPAKDAPYLASFLQTIPGPVVLVAHSYGGFVATNAAAGNPSIKALVYVDAFMPDEGENLAELTADWNSCVSQDALNPVPYAGGLDLYLRWTANGAYRGYTECFANGLNTRQASVLFAGQRPADVAQFSEASGPPAWKTIPSWDLIGTEDHVIPAPLQEHFADRADAHVTRVKAGHLSLITHPAAVTKVILSAASDG
jgi:pimeloyl-ACP methyl ester carboxylesterase